MLADLIDLVLPRRCVGCTDPGPALCHRCLRLTPVSRFLPGVGTVHSAGGYSQGLRRAMLAYKEHDRRDLTGPLAVLLARSVAACARDGPFDAIVPVPSRRAASRARGGDHMSRLVERAELDQPIAAALHMVRRVADSAGLDAGERRANITGAFAATSTGPARAGRIARSRAAGWSLDGARVLIVDDIVTTGATLTEAARALSQAGCVVSGAAVIGATGRRAPSTDADRRAPAAQVPLRFTAASQARRWKRSSQGDNVNLT